MRYALYSSLTALLLMSAPANVSAQTAGRTTLGIGTVELDDVIKGWSVHKTLLGKHVYNDKNEQVGKIEDIIISPSRKEFVRHRQRRRLPRHRLARRGHPGCAVPDDRRQDRPSRRHQGTDQGHAGLPLRPQAVVL